MLELKMKYFLFLLHILFVWAVDKDSETTQPTPTTPSYSQDDYLNNYSVQDILSSDIDSNEKIEKKIINAISEFSSNCNNYKRIDLSLNEFTFPKKSVAVDLGKRDISFYNFTLIEESDSAVERESYSTLVTCNSSKQSKVEVTLPTNIKILANVKVIQNANFSNGLSSRLINEGSISISLKNISVAKQFIIQINNFKHEYDIKPTISYFKTEVLLEIDTKYQKLIYNELDSFLNEIESPLQQFFVDKLTVKLIENDVSVIQSCSKFVNGEKKSEINLPFSTNDFNIYVIPKVSLETWKGVSLSTGPIIIQGLSHFNSIEMIVSGTESSRSLRQADYNYTATSPRFDDAEKKETTVRIKTNSLKGKLDWNYNSKQRSFPFFIDFVVFEIRRSKSFRHKRQTPTGLSQFYNGSYPESNKLDVNLVLENIQIKSSNPNMNESENEFVNFVLSEYLKTVLKDTFINSLNDKLQNNSSVVNC